MAIPTMKPEIGTEAGPTRRVSGRVPWGQCGREWRRSR